MFPNPRQNKRQALIFIHTYMHTYIYINTYIHKYIYIHSQQVKDSYASNTPIICLLYIHPSVANTLFSLKKNPLFSWLTFGGMLRPRTTFVQSEIQSPAFKVLQKCAFQTFSVKSAFWMEQRCRGDQGIIKKIKWKLKTHLYDWPSFFYSYASFFTLDY